MQLLDVDPQDQAEEDGGHMDLDSQRKGKCAVIKTSTRQVHFFIVCDLMTSYLLNLCLPSQTYFLPVIGLVDPKDLSPGDLVVRLYLQHLSSHAGDLRDVLTFIHVSSIFVK